jgi:hypothetical protein
MVATARADRPTLYGRADLQARCFYARALSLVPTPEPRNHVNVSGWPTEKGEQKSIAQEMAASATYIRKPTAQSL